jgi:serine protease AprX
MVNIINVKISNDDGSATTTSVVQGLQWVLENKTRYNIRVVNLSLNATVAESYYTSPLDAAVEILWFNKIVVVSSAGNQGSDAIYPPANDPFIITVGATDDMNTSSLADDAVASFSAYGTTSEGVKKPDLVAPGKNIIARLVNTNMGLGRAHPSNIISGTYFMMSGTSVAAPVVSGAVALLLQDEPNLNPDQVKYRLMAAANKNWPGYNLAKAGAGYLDVYAAIQSSTTQSANTGIDASQLLWTGSQPITWGSVAWNSVAWNSVAWNSVAWNSVAWNSVAWNSDYWGP